MGIACGLAALCSLSLLARAPAPAPRAGRPFVCEGHETFVVSIAVSPDGKLVASGSDDQTLRFWRAADGKALRTVRPAPFSRGGWVGALAFSPDGKTVVANTPGDGGLQLLDAQTGKPVPGWAPVKEGAYGAAFSSDGKLLAAASNNWVRLYDVGRGAVRREFTYDRRLVGRAWHVAFTPDGKHLAAALHRYGGREREGPLVRVWEVATGKEVFTGWEGGHANAVAFSPDGRLLAAGGENNGTVAVYDWRAGKRLVRFQADRHGVFCLAFSADGKTLFTGGTGPDVRVWDAASGKEAGALKGHSDQVLGLALSKDGRVLATAGRDRRVLIWHLGGGR
jgi:WD40 repeat protein